MNTKSRYHWLAKAIHGSAAATVGSLVIATVDSTGISLNEALVAAGVALAAFGSIYFSGPTLERPTS